MNEIYIDGCNVAECKYYHYKGCSANGLQCKNCPDCYFKQLQRLKAENEKLKAENEKLEKNIEALENKLQLRMASDKESDAT